MVAGGPARYTVTVGRLHSWRGWVSVALAGVLGAVGGCGADASTSSHGAEATEALSFYEQMSDAGARRVAGVARYTAPDGVLDARASTGRRVEGRDEQQRLLAMWFGQTMGEVSLERLYVDADQALALYRQAPRGSATEDFWWMALDTVTDEGIALRSVLISSSGDGEVPDSLTLHQAEQLADEHRAVWDSGADAQAAALYAPDAVLRDTLRDEELVGAGAIAEAVAASEVSWQPMELGQRKVPAVFAHQTSPYSGELTRVVSLVSDGEAALAIDLGLDEDGRVTEERRFHPADALPEPVDGRAVWWSGMAPPPAAADGPAVELRTPHGVIEVRGADDATLDRLRWAIERFTVAGLDVPRVSGIVVDPYGPDCDGASGVARLSGSRAVITVCPNAAALCEDDACTRPRAYPSQSILHELAHAWLADNVSDADRARFVAATGLSSWGDRGVDWSRRGEEVAAETLSWGLMDVPVVLHRLDDPEPETLVSWYLELTGREPLVPWQETKDHLP